MTNDDRTAEAVLELPASALKVLARALRDSIRDLPGAPGHLTLLNTVTRHLGFGATHGELKARLAGATRIRSSHFPVNLEAGTDPAPLPAAYNLLVATDGDNAPESWIILPAGAPVPSGYFRFEIGVDFLAQAWIRDLAMSVDPDGDTAYPVTGAILALPVETLRFLLNPSHQRDALQQAGTAPQWVRDWSGPFEIELTSEYCYSAEDLIGWLIGAREAGHIPDLPQGGTWAP